ncbi:MAG TPA: hypothetical protein VGB74_18725, partial [Actinoplanes sp.]
RQSVQPVASRQYPPPMFHRAVDDPRRENLMTGDTEPHSGPRTKLVAALKDHDDTVSNRFR